jgi:hypothetical protein
MRLIDMAHYWSKCTHATYQGKLRVIRTFESHYDIGVLRPTPLLRPPNGREIPLMWCQEAYSLRHSPSKRNEDPELSTLAFSSIRQLRSAASSQFLTWDLISIVSFLLLIVIVSAGLGVFPNFAWGTWEMPLLRPPRSARCGRLY